MFCDGKWDCPKGLDESQNEGCGSIRSCINMLKCKGSQICIHLKNICDGIVDCPNGNDEGDHCSWNIAKCPRSCQCLISAVYCFNVTYRETDIIHSGRFNFFAVFIDNSIISETFLNLKSKDNSMTYEFIYTFSIQNGKIKEPCFLVKSMVNLIHIHLGFNYITILRKQCFNSFLKGVSVNDNQLHSINTNIFQRSTSLIYLNLSNNHLKNLVFFKLENLIYLSVLNNMLESLAVIKFNTPRLLVLESDDFRWCCLTSSGTKCTSQKPWFKSCEHLLSNLAIKITFYNVSFFILILNSSSLVLLLLLKIKKVEKQASFSLIVGSINLLDIMYCVSLFILWSVDLYYKGEYIIKDEEWRSDKLCFFVLSINLYFNLLSPLLLCFMSVARLMVVIHPLDSAFKETKYVLKYLIRLKIVSGAIVVLIATLVRIFDKMIPTQLCSPFVDPTNSFLFTKFLTWIFTIVQFSASFSIIVIYSILLKNLKESREKFKEAMSKIQSEFPLIIQLVIVCTSNILCWFPSGIIYITSMFLYAYPIEMIIWTTIAVVPINCIINPIVFIITNLRKFRE